MNKREGIKMYVNVKKGLDQLYLSQVLEIVTTILSVLMIIFSAITLVASAFSGGIAALMGGISLIFTIGFVVSALAGFVLGLLGVLNAEKDEPSYRKALTWLVIGIIISIIDTCINGQTGGFWKFLQSVVGAVGSFANFMVVYSVINATVVVANAIQNYEVASLGEQRATSFKTIYIIAIILGFLNFIPFIGGILAFVGAVMELVIFFQYLGFLGKAKMMV